MAKEKINLVEVSIDQLQADLSSLQAEYNQAKFDHTVKGMANPMELREMRRNIARYHTEARRRELATMPAEQLAVRTKIRARRRGGK